MDKLWLPFAPSTLTLAIAASLVATGAGASEQKDNGWQCQVLPNGQWFCGSETVKQTPSTMAKYGVKPADLVTGSTSSQSVSSQPPSSQSASVQSAAAPVTAHTSGNGYSLRTQLNWHPLNQLPATLRAAQPFYSCGAYIEPERPGKDFSGDNNQQPMAIEADESSYDQNEVANFKGNVLVRQGSRQFESGEATLNRNTGHGSFAGDVHYRDKGVLLVGDKGTVNSSTGRATLDNAAYALYDQNARGQANYVLRNEDTSFDLSDATYTTCPPGENGWQLSGSQVSLDLVEGQGIARNAVLRVKGLPILYTPVISFPIDDRRKTGFLYPTFAVSSDNGVDISTPYYINIAPAFDATVTPRNMTKRGVLLENEFRYLAENDTLGRSEGELGLAGLLNKDKLKEDNPDYDKQRWLINYRHSTYFTDRWKADIDYARASDKNYLEDFSTNLNVSSESPLNQRIGTRYLGGDGDHTWQLSIDAQQYQNMHKTADDPYNKLPEVKFGGRLVAADAIHLHYMAEYTKFSRDSDWNYVREITEQTPNVHKRSVYDEGYSIKRANGERLYVESGVSLPIERSYGFLRPSLSVQHVEYRLDNLIRSDVVTDLTGAYRGSFTADDYTESPKTTVPVFSLDTGLYFDRTTAIGDTSFTHTVEPRLKYLYSPYEKGQEMNPVFDSSLMGFNYSALWRDNRFSGHDRLGDANQLSVGIVTRFLEDDGFERFRFGLGQILYFEDRQLWISPEAGVRDRSDENLDIDPSDQEKRLRREMQESVSPLASEMVYNLTRTMNLRQDLSWRSADNQLDNYGLYYQYRPSDRKVFNVGYRYVKQADRFVKDAQDNNVRDRATGQLITTSNNLNITDLSFAWPVTERWAALGRWQQDVTNNRNLELLSGVEYNSCCYKVRLFWRKWIESDNNIDFPDYKRGIMLQFVLRGLGDFGSGSTKKLLKGINGYAGDEK